MTDKQNVVCPPDQVFAKPDFEFLLTIGGDLVTDENEYEKLRILLRAIGETEFYILENIGATITDRNIPFQTTISIDEDYNKFQQIVKSFDPPFGWTANHYFVFGKNDNWGIYICEYPTINIIGCDKELSDRFRQVFSIVKDGYGGLEEFLNQEFQSKPDIKSQFIKEYRLEYKT